MKNKYKVLKEFDRFYLAKSSNGWKETFYKYEYMPDEEGYITRRRGKYNKKNSASKNLDNSSSNKYDGKDAKLLFFEELMEEE